MKIDRLAFAPWFACALLLIAFVIGGASQEALSLHQIFNLGCWIVLLLTCIALPSHVWSQLPRLPIILFAAFCIWSLFQIVPVSFDGWWFEQSSLYDSVRSERRVLGLNTQGFTLSMAPGETIRSLLGFGPPLLAFLLISVLDLRWRLRVIWVLIGLGLISFAIGFAQIFLGPNAPVHIWDNARRTSFNGIFANPNHHGTFAAILLALVYSFIARHRHKFFDGDDGLGLALGLIGLFVFVIIGVVAAGSVAGYGLAVFATLAAVFFLRSGRQEGSDTNRFALLLPVLIVVAAASLVYSSPRLSGLGSTSLDTAETSRFGIMARSTTILEENYVTGTGLGSFEEIYRLYEDPERVTNTFINNAHNDWLEWAIETGIPGMLLLAVFVVWVGQRVFVNVWQRNRKQGERLAQAASIAILVIALHSLVDYPLRTPFLATVFGALLALTVSPVISPSKVREAEAEPEAIRTKSL